MYELKSIGVFATAKTMGVMYVVFGEILSLFAAAGALVSGHPIRAVLAVILIGPIYGAVGFVFVAIGAWIYNHVALWVGGAEIELVQRPGA